MSRTSSCNQQPGADQTKTPASSEGQSLLGPVCPCYQGQVEYYFCYKTMITENTIFDNVVTIFFQFSSIQSLSHVRGFGTPWTAAPQASLSITTSWSLLKLITIESVMPSNHLIFCCPLHNHIQSFPASGFFPRSQFFTSGGQNIRVSVSAPVLPMNTQD